MRKLFFVLLATITHTAAFAAEEVAPAQGIVLENGRYRTEASWCDRITVIQEDTVFFEFADSDRTDCQDAGEMATASRQSDGTFLVPYDPGKRTLAEVITPLSNRHFKSTTLDRQNQPMFSTLYRKIAD